MKTRKGYVSNSSSSSFLIKLDNLSKKQIDRIVNYQDSDYYKKHKCDPDWIISMDEDVIEGNAWMDNFDFGEYLDRIGVDENDIKWGD